MAPSIHSDSLIPTSTSSLLITASNNSFVMMENALNSPKEEIIDAHEREIIAKEEEASVVANLNRELTKEINSCFMDKRRRLSSKLFSSSSEPLLEKIGLGGLNPNEGRLSSKLLSSSSEPLLEKNRLGSLNPNEGRLSSNLLSPSSEPLLEKNGLEGLNTNEGRLSSKLLSPPLLEKKGLGGLNPNEGVVKSIKDLVDAGINYVPKLYIRAPEERPRLSQVNHTFEVPVIDMQGLLESSHHDKIIDAIGHACKEWGIFQVINHGVPESAIENMIKGAKGFFHLPSSERALHHSNDVNKPVVYVTSFNQQKETLLNWKDSLRFRYSPTEMENFAKLPPICRETTMEYCKEVRVLGGRIYEGLAESLGLRGDYLEGCMGEKVASIHVNMHYYPPCPEPGLTFGLCGHSDPNLFTVLATLDNVHGLQLFKDGAWLSFTPLPHSLLVNIGDQMEILTNGKYKSVEHRVITNSERPRISVATFFGPSDNALVGPLPELVGPKLLYKATLYKDYVSNFYNKGLARKSSLDFASLLTP